MHGQLSTREDPVRFSRISGRLANKKKSFNCEMLFGAESAMGIQHFLFVASRPGKPKGKVRAAAHEFAFCYRTAHQFPAAVGRKTHNGYDRTVALNLKPLHCAEHKGNGKPDQQRRNHGEGPEPSQYEQFRAVLLPCKCGKQAGNTHNSHQQTGHQTTQCKCYLPHPVAWPAGYAPRAAGMPLNFHCWNCHLSFVPIQEKFSSNLQERGQMFRARLAANCRTHEARRGGCNPRRV